MVAGLRLPPGSARQRGFTLMEVLVSVIVFAIAVVGLVSMESRSIESQAASAQLREGERVAEDVMADLESRSFIELVTRDFAGNISPTLPYDDSGVSASSRLRDFRRPPADIDETQTVVGALKNRYLVQRSVSWVIDSTNAPSNPPDMTGTDAQKIEALVLDVTVMWIDDTNPAYPPPSSLTVTDLTPAMTEPGNAAYAPYVGYVTLRTVRVNDATLAAPAAATGGTT